MLVRGKLEEPPATPPPAAGSTTAAFPGISASGGPAVFGDGWLKLDGRAKQSLRRSVTVEASCASACVVEAIAWVEVRGADPTAALDQPVAVGPIRERLRADKWEPVRFKLPSRLRQSVRAAIAVGSKARVFFQAQAAGPDGRLHANHAVSKLVR